MCCFPVLLCVRFSSCNHTDYNNVSVSGFEFHGVCLARHEDIGVASHSRWVNLDPGKTTTCPRTHTCPHLITSLVGCSCSFFIATHFTPKYESGFSPLTWKPTRQRTHVQVFLVQTEKCVSGLIQDSQVLISEPHDWVDYSLPEGEDLLVCSWLTLTLIKPSEKRSGSKLGRMLSSEIHQAISGSWDKSICCWGACQKNMQLNLKQWNESFI